MTRLFYIIFSAFAFLLLSYACEVKGMEDKLKEEQEESVFAEDHTTKEMQVKEFLSWCEDKDNKLNKEKEISDIRFRLSFLPAEAMAFLELRTEPYDLLKFNQVSKNYSSMSYFKFQIEVIDGRGEPLKYQLNSPSQYEDRIKYMSFEMQDDLCLIQGKDTLLPGLFHFERIFEVAPYVTVMLAYDNEKFDPSREFTIVYNDRLFEKGYVKFNYKNKQLINLPNISGL